MNHTDFIFPDISRPLRGRASSAATIGEFKSVMVKPVIRANAWNTFGLFPFLLALRPVPLCAAGFDLNVGVSTL
jgi:hypothetical protein